MGNGHPIAAVIARGELAERFNQIDSYFNTFGGNPVSAAAALAVLDIVVEERLQENAAEQGRYLRRGLLTSTIGPDDNILKLRPDVGLCKPAACRRVG